MQAPGVVGDHKHVHDEAEQAEEHQTHCEDNVSNAIQSRAEDLPLQSVVGSQVGVPYDAAVGTEAECLDEVCQVSDHVNASDSIDACRSCLFGLCYLN